MARIWQEGFEDGLPNAVYLEGGTINNPLDGISFTGVSGVGFPTEFVLYNGRNSLSKMCIKMRHITQTRMVKRLESTYNELYFRTYFKHEKVGTGTFYDLKSTITLLDNTGNLLLSLYNTNIASPNDWAVYCRLNGSYTKVADVNIASNVWHKIELYLKINGTTGAYEVRVNDTNVASDASVNTGTNNIQQIELGTRETVSDDGDLFFDDIAINDTTGSVNNSWCGSGTIISLKPKGSGNYSQFDNSEGFAKAEDGTTTTNIEITGHGLSTNDVIFNKTRNQYRIVTVVDANNLTVSTVTGQSENDIILMYENIDTITNTIPTTTNDDKYVVLVGHTLQSGDVFINTTRSNAIRKVIYVNNDNVYNYYLTGLSGVLGENISTQASGDTIKTFTFKPYAISNHYESVANNTDPSPKLSYIQSSTSNDIDSFDMEELVADKGLPSGANVVAVSHNIYAQEAGAGSEIKPLFRISSTDYAGDTIALSGGTKQYQKIYETSPATSNAWTVSEVDGLEAGAKVV